MTCHRRSRPKSGFKVTREQRSELIALWIAGDLDEVTRRQRELGVSASYAAHNAAIAGVHRRSDRVDINDPRWEWAKKRGAVNV